MSFLAKHIQGKTLKDDALKIGNEAKKVEGSINGTLGQFLPFSTPSFVKETLNTFKDEDLFSYSPTNGGDIFARATIKHLGINLPSKVVATPGGSGALGVIINNTLDRDESLIIPTPCWKPYFDMAKLRNINPVTYELIKDGKYNLAGFKEVANKVISSQNKLVFILNDPCHNPTGYSLKASEMKALIDYLNTLTCPVVFIYDCAYKDLNDNNEDVLKCFESINENILIASCVSYSKTFQVYGQRIGALVLSSKVDVSDVYDSVLYYARNTWSNTNKAMLSLVSKVIEDNTLYSKLNESLDYIKKELKVRSKIFLDEASKVGLETYPYDGGYFISIPSSNPSLVCEKLKESKIYLLPVLNIVRVAICGISPDKLVGLASKIKEVNF